MLGVVQEQHSERAKLYKQWKQFDFPILQDATTQLDLWVVPFPVLIDEHGVIRNKRPRLNDLADFVKQKFDPPTVGLEPPASHSEQSVDNWIAKGNQALHAQKIRITDAIQAFTHAVKIEPKNGKALFGLGVAFRMRFDSDQRQSGDFKQAHTYWLRALASNPNQYIWRRRIEQYGPRLTKPYPFYDWVEQAKREIASRGDRPIQLKAALTGTEIATVRDDSSTDAVENPDPMAKIFPDENNFVSLTSTVVPAITNKKKAARIHIEFSIQNAKWNHEAGPLVVWIDESSNGKPENRLIEQSRLSSKLNDQAPKSIDFEFLPNANTGSVFGFALFHCCDDDGVCYYYRKDFQIPFQLN